MPIDPDQHTPIYEQIIDHVASAIVVGIFRASEPLPSIRAMAIELVVNPNTVQRAYRELELLGLVVKRRGLGVYISDEAKQVAGVRSEQTVCSHFADGIAAAKQAGMRTNHTRELFNRAIKNETDESTPPDSPTARRSPS